MKPIIIDEGVNLSSEVDPAVTEYREWRGVEYGLALYPFEALPNHMKAGVARYILNGIGGGSFLNAVLENNFIQAFNRADDTNMKYMKQWAQFLYSEAPIKCWGSPEEVAAWIESGGVKGQESD